MKDKQEQKTIKINLESKPLASGLYLVGTPIGSLKDISLQALEVLMSVDVVACEDTRITGKLLHHYGIKVKKIKYNDHSDDRARSEIFKYIEDGCSVALCSDAGLPLIADPGYKLAAECVENDVHMTSIPGANAALTGLQLSGFPTDKFSFLGFVPNKAKAREDFLLSHKGLLMTQVYYESAVRILDTVKSLHKILGDRRIAVARELTKRFEEVIVGTCSEVIEKLEANPVKGEIVLVVSANVEGEIWDEEKIRSSLEKLIVEEGSSIKDAVKEIVFLSGKSKNDIYAIALEIKNGK